MQSCTKNSLISSWLLLDKSTRIEVRHFQTALAFTGMDVENVEVECFLSNMIYKGLIKGYISRERQIVVLSAKDPFPGLSENVVY